MYYYSNSILDKLDLSKIFLFLIKTNNTKILLLNIVKSLCLLHIVCDAIHDMTFESENLNWAMLGLRPEQLDHAN